MDLGSDCPEYTDDDHQEKMEYFQFSWDPPNSRFPVFLEVRSEGKYQMVWHKMATLISFKSSMIFK